MAVDSALDSVAVGASQADTFHLFERYWQDWCRERYDLAFGESRAPPSHLLLRLPQGKELFMSPFGLGTHYMDVASKDAVVLALCHGINVIDTAPNYGRDGGAECAIGEALRKVCEEDIEAARQNGKDRKPLSRSAIVLISKVGNVVGQEARIRCKQVCGGSDAMLSQHAADDNVFHCLHPAWIDSEIQGSLQRLGVSCLDVVLLHNPETQLHLRGYYSSDCGHDADKQLELAQDFYERCLATAFKELERQCELGRIQCYGVSGAFYPLRPSDPQHLALPRILEVAGPRFKVLQFPLNFSEPDALFQSHQEVRSDGTTRGTQKIVGANEVATLVIAARDAGLYVLTNRPLNGIYKEVRGTVRFASEVPMNSALEPEDVDELESKVSRFLDILKPLPPGGNDDEYDPLVTGDLAGKTLLVLSSLQIGTVLCGLRNSEYLASAWDVLFNKMVHLKKASVSELEDAERDLLILGDIPSNVVATRKISALQAVRTIHRSLSMWLVMAMDVGDDRGTAKDWRLPEKGSAENHVDISNGTSKL